MSKAIFSAWRCALAALAFIATSAAGQPAFPAKPIRLIVPYAAGGTTDVLARYIGQKLSGRLGQPVVIDNRAGGGTVIGASAVAGAPPDGYTLLLANNTHYINPHLMKLPYDSLKGFTPVATLATSAYLLLLTPSVSASNLQEFIALAKAKPGALNFGTHGVGGLTHLGAELFSSMAGIRMQMVQYKGAGPALTGMLSGEVNVYLDAPATTLRYIQSGKLKPIGITGNQRLAALPQVPTIAEAGLPGFDLTIWYGLLGPAGMPAAIVDKLNTEINKVLAEPEVTAKLEALGVTPHATSNSAFAAFTRSEHEKYGHIVRENNIRVN